MVSVVRDSEVCDTFVGPRYSRRSRCHCNKFVFNLRDKGLFFRVGKELCFLLPRVLTLPSVTESISVQCCQFDKHTFSGRRRNSLSLLLHCPLFKSLTSHQQCYGQLAMSEILERNHAIGREKNKIASSWQRTLLGTACCVEKNTVFIN